MWSQIWAMVCKHDAYFCNLGDCLASIMTSGLLTAITLHTLTNQNIYDHLANFPQPKVVREAVSGVDYQRVWKWLHLPVLNSEERQIMYLLIHNKLPVKERMFRVGLKGDPYCSSCPHAVEGDREHFFCDCLMTKTAWSWLRSKLIFLSNGGFMCTNNDLLNLFLPPGSNAQEMTWLIRKFV